MQRWFVSRCSLFGFASLVDFVFIPLLLSLSLLLSVCFSSITHTQIHIHIYRLHTIQQFKCAHFHTQLILSLSLSHSFSPAPFSIHNTQITRIHPKFYRFIFSLMCICLFLVKWNFFCFMQHRLSAVCTLVSFCLPHFTLFAIFICVSFCLLFFFHCLQFIYVFSPSIVIVVFGVCVYIFSSEINFCRFFC